MPSTPTTKSQVQAYRFVLRRMQSALVRKDAVMLHDPMRTHSRATIVGVCLAALGLLGFLIWGILSPKPTVPSKDGIIIGKPSGQVYVLLTNPKRLIPVFNMASARLLLYKHQNPDSDKQQAGAPAAASPVSVADPTVVDDNELRDQPRDRKVGIADGPDLLPSQDQRIDSHWTVCDQYKDNDNNDDTLDVRNVETSVIAGVQDRGDQLPAKASLLVRGPNDDVFLVYRNPSSVNEPNTSTVRAKVDVTQKSVLLALGLESPDSDNNSDQIRDITTGLLNAIPEKAELSAPDVGTVGDQPDDNVAPGGKTVGSVFGVERTGGGKEFYVVLKNGIQKIKKTTGDLIRFQENPDETVAIPTESPDILQRSNVLQGRDRVINDDTFPDQKTEVLERVKAPVACLGWDTIGSGDNREERTSVYVGQTVPGVPPGGANGSQWVNISTPGSANVRIQHFYMPPGRAAVVRQATSKEDFNTGGITLISDRGVKYGVPKAQIANVLGLGPDDSWQPAPLVILNLLPDGASLDPQDVWQSYDTVPVEGGEYPTSTSGQPGANGAGQSGPG